MPARIDLTPLFALMTDSPQVQQNPAFQDYSLNDPEATSPDTVQQPRYIPPTRMQQYFHPEASGIINQLNATYASSPITAEHQNDITQAVRQMNIGRMNPRDLPNRTPQELAEMGYGTGDMTPENIVQQNTAVSGLDSGFVPTRAAALHNEASAQAQEAANRARGAALAGTEGLPEQQVETERARQTYESGEYGGETALQPSKFRNMGLNYSNEYQQGLGLKSRIPYLNEEAQAQAEREAFLAKEQLKYDPYYARTLGNEAVRGTVESSQIPIGGPFANIIQPDNSVQTRMRNPYGMSSIAQTMGAMGDINNMGGKPMVVKDNNGNTFTVPNTGIISRNMNTLTGVPNISHMEHTDDRTVPTIGGFNPNKFSVDSFGNMQEKPETYEEMSARHDRERAAALKELQMKEEEERKRAEDEAEQQGYPRGYIPGGPSPIRKLNYTLPYANSR